MIGRTAELAANLAQLQARIAAACQQAGRDAAEITVIAVSKTWPSTDIRILHELGLRDFGENRDQEAHVKAAELSDLALRWHFIGQLQTNKAKSVARYADLVHSVDRPELIAALDAAALSAKREVACLLQVSVDPTAPAGRGGVQPGELVDLARQVSDSAALRLAGLMTVAPLGIAAAAAFAPLPGIVQEFQGRFPTARLVSAGMSGDFEQAIAAGATHLRIGSLLLGNRGLVG